MSQKGAPLDIVRRRIFYRANHRGTKEMDWMLGRFAERFVDEMDVEALQEFERFIDISDDELRHILIGNSEGDIAREYSVLIEKIRRFNGL